MKRRSNSPRSKFPMGDVWFEIQRVGKIMRVTAIDPRTGTEVITIADPKHGDHAIRMLAARKLAYVLEKNKKKHLGLK